MTPIEGYIDIRGKSGIHHLFQWLAIISLKNFGILPCIVWIKSPPIQPGCAGVVIRAGTMTLRRLYQKLQIMHAALHHFLVIACQCRSRRSADDERDGSLGECRVLGSAFKPLSHKWEKGST